MSADLAEDQCAVGTAKTERVRQRAIDCDVARDLRYVIEIAIVARVVEIDRRRRNLMANGERGEDRLDRTGRAEQMSDHRLGRIDRHARVGTEQGFDRRRFGDVALWRRTALGT